jgi:hypothetical protein
MLKRRAWTSSVLGWDFIRASNGGTIFFSGNFLNFVGDKEADGTSTQEDNQEK